MTAATRERKLAFIKEFSRYGNGLGKACAKMLDIHGPDWLTDEQLDDIANQKIRDHRFSQKLNRENRALRKASS